MPGKGGGNQVLKGSSLYPASGGESLLSLKQGLSGSGQSCICKKVTVLHGEEQARCGGGRTETGWWGAVRMSEADSRKEESVTFLHGTRLQGGLGVSGQEWEGGRQMDYQRGVILNF